MRFVIAFVALLGLAACSAAGSSSVPVSVTLPPVTVTGPNGVQGTVSSSGGLSITLPSGPVGVAPGVAVQASGPLTVAVPAAK